MAAKKSKKTVKKTAKKNVKKPAPKKAATKTTKKAQLTKLTKEDVQLAPGNGLAIGAVALADEDPIIIRGSGSGDEPKVEVNIGLVDDWVITSTAQATTIVIPKTSKWQIEKDRVTTKIYLECKDIILENVEIDDMEDDQGNPAPRQLFPDASNNCEIEFNYSVFKS